MQKVGLTYTQARDELRNNTQAMTAFHRHRYEFTLASKSPSIRDFLTYIPYILHYNQPGMKFYEPHAACGVANFLVNKEIFADFSDYVAYNASLLEAPKATPIQGIYVMGSVTSVTFTSDSDIDLWVIVEPNLEASSRKALYAKLKQISSWFQATYNIEVSFYLVDTNHLLYNRHNNQYLNEGGIREKVFLLDEFYRSATKIAGKWILWYFLPELKGYSYQEVKQAYIDFGLINPVDWIDFGGMELTHLSRQAFYATSLWLIYKGLHNPFKSFIKICLLEAYFSEFPNTDLVSVQMKKSILKGYEHKASNQEVLALWQKIYQNQELEPYVHSHLHYDAYELVLTKVMQYLILINDTERAYLVFTSFLLKVHKHFAPSLQNIMRGLKIEESDAVDYLLEHLDSPDSFIHVPRDLRVMTVRLRNKFASYISLVDVKLALRFRYWHIGELVKYNNNYKRALIKTYMQLYNFMMNSLVNPQEMKISFADHQELREIERTVSSLFVNHRNQIKIYNQYPELDLTESYLYFGYFTGKEHEVVWYVVNIDKNNPGSNPERKHIEVNYDFISLVCWCYFNGLITNKTQLQLKQNPYYSQEFLINLIKGLRKKVDVRSYLSRLSRRVSDYLFVDNLPNLFNEKIWSEQELVVDNSTDQQVNYVRQVEQLFHQEYPEVLAKYQSDNTTKPGTLNAQEVEELDSILTKVSLNETQQAEQDFLAPQVLLEGEEVAQELASQEANPWTTPSRLEPSFTLTTGQSSLLHWQEIAPKPLVLGARETTPSNFNLAKGDNYLVSLAANLQQLDPSTYLGRHEYLRRRIRGVAHASPVPGKSWNPALYQSVHAFVYMPHSEGQITQPGNKPALLMKSLLSFFYNFSDFAQLNYFTSYQSLPHYQVYAPQLSLAAQGFKLKNYLPDLAHAGYTVKVLSLAKPQLGKVQAGVTRALVAKVQDTYSKERDSLMPIKWQVMDKSPFSHAVSQLWHSPDQISSQSGFTSFNLEQIDRQTQVKAPEAEFFSSVMHKARLHAAKLDRKLWGLFNLPPSILPIRTFGQHPGSGELTAIASRLHLDLRDYFGIQHLYKQQVSTSAITDIATLLYAAVENDQLSLDQAKQQQQWQATLRQIRAKALQLAHLQAPPLTYTLGQGYISDSQPQHIENYVANQQIELYEKQFASLVAFAQGKAVYFTAQYQYFPEYDIYWYSPRRKANKHSLELQDLDTLTLPVQGKLHWFNYSPQVLGKMLQAFSRQTIENRNYMNYLGNLMYARVKLSLTDKEQGRVYHQNLRYLTEDYLLMELGEQVQPNLGEKLELNFIAPEHASFPEMMPKFVGAGKGIMSLSVVMDPEAQGKLKLDDSLTALTQAARLEKDKRASNNEQSSDRLNMYLNILGQEANRPLVVDDNFDFTGEKSYRLTTAVTHDEPPLPPGYEEEELEDTTPHTREEKLNYLLEHTPARMDPVIEAYANAQGRVNKVTISPSLGGRNLISLASIIGTYLGEECSDMDIVQRYDQPDLYAAQDNSIMRNRRLEIANHLLNHLDNFAQQKLEMPHAHKVSEQESVSITTMNHMARIFTLAHLKDQEEIATAYVLVKYRDLNQESVNVLLHSLEQLDLNVAGVVGDFVEYLSLVYITRVGTYRNIRFTGKNAFTNLQRYFQTHLSTSSLPSISLHKLNGPDVQGINQLLLKALNSQLEIWLRQEQTKPLALDYQAQRREFMRLYQVTNSTLPGTLAYYEQKVKLLQKPGVMQIFVQPIEDENKVSYHLYLSTPEQELTTYYNAVGSLGQMLPAALWTVYPQVSKSLLQLEVYVLEANTQVLNPSSLTQVNAWSKILGQEL
ncbi:hypothetical protein CJP74_01610 [Psittacicella melopsittaci]|uniref:Adenylate cyclase class-I N-terminal domain-containing protein n=1 Tax=Psittacicella melopsittaci TaxID=2028576 RepID=A0A3A1Y8Q5_9GAMM|nr:class I adenylate cyclase [Psittacicella melopsittaci]RIY33589.1 hypothetical protein CJP74_01610 [Psittacicella melopsittaci]